MFARVQRRGSAFIFPVNVAGGNDYAEPFCITGSGENVGKKYRRKRKRPRLFPLCCCLKLVHTKTSMPKGYVCYG
jgi:hypothetical protein